MGVLELLGKRGVFFDGAVGTVSHAKPAAWAARGTARALESGKAGSDRADASRRPRCRCRYCTDTTRSGEYAIRLRGCGRSVQRDRGRRRFPMHGTRWILQSDAYVAMDIGRTGKLLRPLGDLSFEEAYEAFKEAARDAEKKPALTLS